MASSSSSAAAPVARWEGRFRATTMANHKASAPPLPPQEQTGNEMQIVALDPGQRLTLLIFRITSCWRGLSTVREATVRDQTRCSDLARAPVKTFCNF